MAEEIGELDLTAQANAAQTATSYITAIDSDGIKVHAANNASTNYAGIDATGLEVVRGGTSMAKFGEVARIGKAYVSGATDNESHMELDYHSLKLVDREGNEFFEVEDLRGTNGIAQLITKYIGDGETKKFDFQNAYPDDTSYTVTVSDNSGGSQTKSTYSVTFSSAPTKGAVITVTYNTSSRLVKTYTAGFRDDDYSAGPLSLAEGYETVANGFASHAEGLQTKALREMAHAEGTTSTASGISSHAQGSSTTASGNSSHAEGSSTTASGNNSHAEGRTSVARGLAAHAEGSGCEALDYAHAEGMDTVAMGPASHSQGWHTHAKRQAQTAIGTFNVIDTSAPEDTTHPWGTGRGDEYNTGEYALIIGNGTADNARSNALAVDWNGNVMAQAMAGIIQMFAGATPPSGWLVCDGSAVSRDTYATLFSAIGTTWGAGDGSTTFNLPDLRGRAPIGAGSGSGLTARTLGTQNIGSENVQAHTHSISRTTNVAVSDSGHTHPAATTDYYYALGSATFAKQSGTAQSGSSGLTNAVRQSGTVTSNKNTGSGKASLSVTQPVFSVGAVSGATTGTAGNMQPSAVVNFIICTGKTS